MFGSMISMLALMVPLLIAQVGVPRSTSAPRSIAPAARAALPHEVPPWEAAPGTHPSAEARWNALLAHLHDAPRPIVFVGDSITQNWLGYGKPVWDATFAPLGAYDLGISGDTTQNTLWRIGNGELDNLTPRVVVVMIGTNDLFRWSSADTAHGVQAVVDAIRLRTPTSQILVLGLTPRDPSPGSPMRLKTVDTNRALAAAIWPPYVTYRDIGATLLADDGTLLPDAMVDGRLHPSAAGYQRMAVAILPEVQRLAAIAH